MNFYDIVADACPINDSFAKRLGFKKIFHIGNGVAADNDKGKLISKVKNGASAVMINDLAMEAKLINSMKEYKAVLIIPMDLVTASYGIERSRNIYKIRKLYMLAKKKGIDVCFASMAKTPQYMNSSMQLLELAKLIGADEKYARYSISEITKSIVSE